MKQIFFVLVYLSMLTACEFTRTRSKSDMPLFQLCFAASCSVIENKRTGGQDAAGETIEKAFDEAADQQGAPQNTDIAPIK
jgi:hypothetical protein